MKRLSATIVVIGLLIATRAEAVVMRIPLEPDLDVVDVPVRSGQRVDLFLPEPITYWALSNTVDYKPTVRGRDMIFGVDVGPNAPESNLNLQTWTWIVSVRFRPALPNEKHTHRVEFIPPKQTPADTGTSSRAADSDFMNHKLDEQEVTPGTTIEWRDGAHALTLQVGVMSWGTRYLAFRFQLQNRGDYSYPIEAIELRDPRGRQVEIEVHTPFVELGRDFALHTDDRFKGAIYVSDARALRSGWSLQLRTSAGVVPATFQWNDAPPAKGPLNGRLAITAHVLAGAANLGDGIGLERDEWTSMLGLGGRVLYGVTDHLSLEGTLDVARSTPVVFEDATWDTDQGALTVSDTSARVLVGGLLHTGKRWIPFSRLSFGVVVSSRDKELMTHRENDLDTSLTVGLGGGLAVRFGAHFIAALSLGYAGSLEASGASTFEAGLSLGTSWNLAR